MPIQHRFKKPVLPAQPIQHPSVPPLETGPQPLLVDINGAAKLLSSTPWTIRGLLWARKIPFIKVGKRFLIDPADLRNFIAVRRKGRGQRERYFTPRNLVYLPRQIWHPPQTLGDQSTCQSAAPVGPEESFSQRTVNFITYNFGKTASRFGRVRSLRSNKLPNQCSVIASPELIVVTRRSRNSDELLTPICGNGYSTPTTPRKTNLSKRWPMAQRRSGV